MTAISFKSESGDDYLEISQRETIEELTFRLADKHKEEWSFLNVVLISTTEHNEEELRTSIIYSQ